ncbi:DUF2948 family protein [Aminobacter aminovorans]|uniref:Protein of uncharacterized function (DUF2948) n=1 Tax=Aminobacter aminovorans TaxID=83263 RepID=A0A380WR28_AMIAI|nr:DUF2948 family protein [Aminobacter aminovorans]TCS30560.1 DUF2948 family protein [Aminobacter aminovorans]SUU91409.1 Protein of uncharacterised function (DUF2948) [Aminobacter aminovorans]
MNLLKLVALDEEDLEIVSAHVQDAVIRVGDIAFDAPAKRFALAMNRFAWETKKGFFRPKYERRRSILHFDRVLSAQLQGISRAKTDDVLELLAIGFAQEEGPTGTIELLFSGDAAIRLDVEVIEARLTDTGAAWQASSRPIHNT